MNKIFAGEMLGNERIGTLPFRCHYIPFAKGDKPRYRLWATIKESSSEVISLNGAWGFQAYDKYQDLPYSREELTEARHNYDLVDKGLVHVSLDIAMAGVVPDLAVRV